MNSFSSGDTLTQPPSSHTQETISSTVSYPQQYPSTSYPVPSYQQQYPQYPASSSYQSQYPPVPYPSTSYPLQQYPPTSSTIPSSTTYPILHPWQHYSTQQYPGTNYSQLPSSSTSPPVSYPPVSPEQQYFPQYQSGIGRSVPIPIPEPSRGYPVSTGVPVLDPRWGWQPSSSPYTESAFSQDGSIAGRDPNSKYPVPKAGKRKAPGERPNISIMKHLQVYNIDDQIMKSADQYYNEIGVRHRKGAHKDGVIGLCIQKAYEKHGVNMTISEISKLTGIDSKKINRAKLDCNACQTGIESSVHFYSPSEIIEPVIKSYEDCHQMLFSMEIRTRIITSFTRISNEKLETKKWNQHNFAIAYLYRFLSLTCDVPIKRFSEIYKITPTTINTYIDDLKKLGI